MNNEFLKIASEAAKTAGKMLLKKYGRVNIIYKSDNSVVTEADLEADSYIVKEIEDNFPSHSILSEESGEKDKSSDYVWIIDPLDGSSNYSTNNPFFAVSLGLRYKKNTILGVVYFPIQDELFFASKEKGAFLNGNRITVNEFATVDKSFIAFGNGRDQRSKEEIIKIYSFLKIRNNVVRQVGSPALGLSFVAAGRFGAFIMTGVNAWDAFAGALIIQEAEGIVTDFYGHPFNKESLNIIASSPSLHSELQTNFVNIV